MRDLRQVELDRRVELVDGVVERPQLLRQIEVVVADHGQHAAQHGFNHVGLVQGFACCAADGERGCGQRDRVEVAWAGVASTCARPDQPAVDGAPHEAGEADEGQRQRHVESQVKDHHLLVHGGHELLQQHMDLRHQGDREQRTDDLEDEIAHGQAPHLGRRAAGGDHREDAAAEVGAQHQAQGHGGGEQARRGEGGGQQHDCQARVRQHGEHGADHDVEHDLVGQ